MARKKATKASPEFSASPTPAIPEEKPKKLRAPPVEWDKNKKWTHRAINYLLDDKGFRVRLFSDSTSDAECGK
jgi:hypothetical protein